MAGNIIWTAASFTDHVTVTGGGTPGGGKGGPKQPQYKDHTYSISFASMFCRGPMGPTSQLKKIYADTRLIFDMDTDGQAPHQIPRILPDTTFTAYYGWEDGTDGRQSQDINTEMQAEIDGRLGSGSTSAHRGTAYIFFHEFMITTYGNRIPSITVEWDEGTHDLGEIVSDLYVMAGLTTDHIDVSEISGITIPGASLDTNSNTVRAVLEGLMNAYSFELPEVNGKVTARLLDADTCFSIPFDDIAAHLTSEQRPVPIESTRAKETDLPKTVTIAYLAPSRDYQAGNQPYTDPTIRSSTITSYSINLALDDDQALRTAMIRQQEQILGRDHYVFAVPYKYAALAPADKGFIHDETGLAILVKIISVEGFVPGALKVQAVRYDRSIYTQVAVADSGSFQVRRSGSFAMGTGTGGGGGGGGGGTNPDDGSPGYKILLPDSAGTFLPAVANQTEHTLVGGVYASMKSAGQLLVERVSGSGEYTPFADFPLAATTGVTVGALATVTDPTTWDNVNTVTIQMDGDAILTSQDPSSLILDDTQNKLLFANGEYVQFANATLVLDDTLIPRGLGEPVMYQISTLLRGRHGSDYAVGTHMANEKVSLVDAGLVYVQHEDRLLGAQLNSKFVPYGSIETAAPVVPMNLDGVTQKPLSPVQVYGTRNGGNDLTINWTRRSRNPSSFRVRTAIPIAEEAESYEIDIIGKAITAPAVFDTISGGRTSNTSDLFVIPPYYNSFVKTTSTGWGNCGALAGPTFRPVDYVLDIGLQSDTTSSALNAKQYAVGWTSKASVLSFADIDYCIVVTPDNLSNHFEAFEFGITTGFTLDDIEGPKITISGGIIKYTTELDNLFYSHAILPTVPLRASIALNTIGATVENMMVNGLTVRTIASLSASGAYSAANQVTDFGSTQSAIPIRLYQISADRHRGFPASVTL